MAHTTKTQVKKKRNFYQRKRFKIVALVLILLIAFRIYLPTLVKNQVNKVLADIPGYYGQVKDIDIALIRGAYAIDGMYLNKMNAETQVPFLNFPRTDISIEWKSIFDGKIVSEIIMTSPEIIYVMEDQQTEGEKPNADDWSKALTDLVPVEINHFEVHDGKLAFVQTDADPNIDIHFDKLELTADNLRNVKSKSRTLPSPIVASATSIGNGKVSLKGDMNLIKEIPDMDMEFSLEKADITALNDFTRHYAGIDFKSGTFELFSEVAIADGYMKGYMKPLVENSKLISKEDGVLGVLWEGFVGFFKFLMKNQSTNTFATKIPVEGDLNNVEAGVLPTIVNIFGNAWINAFKGDVDGDIEFKDAFKDGKKEDLTREEKKELRQEKRETRKEQREERREEREKEKEDDQ